MPAKFIIDAEKVTVIHSPNTGDQFNFSYWFHFLVPDGSKHKKGFGTVADGIKWEFDKKYFDKVYAMAERYYEKVTIENLVEREVTKEQLGLF